MHIKKAHNTYIPDFWKLHGQNKEDEIKYGNLCTEVNQTLPGHYNGYFMLCIHFNDFQNITDFARILYQEDRELFQWFREQFPERLCRCPNNRRVYLGDEPRRICGLSSRAEIVNPDDRDMDRAIYVLRKFRNIECASHMA